MVESALVRKHAVQLGSASGLEQKRRSLQAWQLLSVAAYDRSTVTYHNKASELWAIHVRYAETRRYDPSAISCELIARTLGPCVCALLEMASDRNCSTPKPCKRSHMCI